MRTRPILAAATVAGTLLVATDAFAQEPVSEETIAYFRTNCTSCHTIGGGPLAGPDLKDVSKRRDRAQLTKFIQDPKAAIVGGDAYLAKLFADARGVYMPTPPAITADRIAKILDLIDAESALPKSQFAGMDEGALNKALDDPKQFPVYAATGRGIFDGTAPAAAGTPSCIGCHAVDGTGGFGGGRLGPDLTDAFSRLGGRKSLAAWLTSPQSVTMGPVFAGKRFTEDEVFGLVAYLEDRSKQAGGRTAGGAGIFEFLAAGVGGLVAALAAFDWLWRGRFKSVRRTMVEGSRR